MKINEKGFTLIEILAVIIILGILMIIAVPSVTEYIIGSRDFSFVKTADKFIEEAMNEITAMEYSVSNENYTYYIPTKCLETDSDASKTAYGELLDSYVVVTYENGKNEYYYTGIDSSGHGILLAHRSLLSEDLLKTGLKNIDNRVGIGDRQEVYIYSSSCDKTREKYHRTSHIEEKSKLE